MGTYEKNADHSNQGDIVKYAESSNQGDIVILEEVLDILSDSDRWCKGSLALNSSGQRTNTARGNAVSYCLMGAVYRAMDEHRITVSSRLFKTLTDLSGYDNYVVFNDNEKTTHEDVILLVKKAIYELDSSEDPTV